MLYNVALYRALAGGGEVPQQAHLILTPKEMGPSRGQELEQESEDPGLQLLLHHPAL